jgi:CO/xanthine dehydrogenase Mo-binding subunit
MCGAIVIAETEDIADEGVRLLKVEWEEHPFVIDIDKALESGAPLAKPLLNSKNNFITPTFTEEMGDVEKALAEADQKIEFSTDRTYHTWAGVESGSAVARVLGDQVEVWVHGQKVGTTATNISNIFGIPNHLVKVHSPYNGGTYGHGTLPGQLCSPLAVLCTLIAQRPVKFMMDGAVSHFYGGSLDYSRDDIKVGFNNDGKITAVQTNVREGCYAYPTGWGGEALGYVLPLRLHFNPEHQGGYD